MEGWIPPRPPPPSYTSQTSQNTPLKKFLHPSTTDAVTNTGPPYLVCALEWSQCEVTLLLILQGLWSNAHTQCQSSRRSWGSIDFSSTCSSHAHVTWQWQFRVRGDPGYGEEDGAKARGSTPRGQWQAPVIAYKPWCSTIRSYPDRIQLHSVFCVWNCNLTCAGNTNLPMHLKLISVIYSYLTSIRMCIVTSLAFVCV